MAKVKDAVAVPEPDYTTDTALQQLVTTGDLSGLSKEDRVRVFVKAHEAIGADPHLRLFQFIRMPNGSVLLYPRKECAEFLRQKHNATCHLSEERYIPELNIYYTQYRASMNGRYSDNVGVVELPDGMKGEKAANAIMKAHTKGQRRATFSLFALSDMEEGEGGGRVVLVDTETGEVSEPVVQKTAIPAKQVEISPAPESIEKDEGLQIVPPEPLDASPANVAQAEPIPGPGLSPPVAVSQGIKVEADGQKAAEYGFNRFCKLRELFGLDNSDKAAILAHAEKMDPYFDEEVADSEVWQMMCEPIRGFVRAFKASGKDMADLQAMAKNGKPKIVAFANKCGYAVDTIEDILPDAWDTMAKSIKPIVSPED